MRKGYYASINHVDREIGKLYNWLQKKAYQKNTYIIICSDHGDMIGDHYIHKKAVPFEASAKIPFVVYAPDLPPEHRGKISHVPASLMDIMPTILEWAEITPAYPTDGESLVSAINNNDSEYETKIDRYFVN